MSIGMPIFPEKIHRKNSNYSADKYEKSKHYMNIIESKKAEKYYNYEDIEKGLIHRWETSVIGVFFIILHESCEE